MPVIEVAGLKFGYTNTPLFENVTFRLEAGERAALVAPNGAGKSTLLRAIGGEITPDAGSVVIKKGASVGYYRQSHESRLEGSVRDAMLAGFGDLVALRRELSRAQADAASGEKSALEHLSELTERYHHAGADALEHQVEAIATELGFRESDLERDVKTLSGGERGRLELGLVLATDAELLLLDEPTNHLDLDTIRWLEGHLSGLRAAVLVVSHDRAFLDAACPFTFELGQRTFRTYPLPYSAYHEERAADLERERKLAEEQAAMVAKTEDFIRKNIAGQKTKQAQSRRRMLEKLERVERPEDVWARAAKVRFRFAEAPRSGDIVLEAKGLGAERGGQTLFSGVDILIRRGDRVAVVGPNGSGKTTMMKILAERGMAGDRGEVRRGTNLRDGYFDQQLGSLDPKKSGVEEIRSVRGDLNVDGAREYLARFRFYADDPLRKVASLSGGERTRLALAKLLLEPRNLLYLDEPTNHLDIPAAEILEEALVGFEGTVILVSHDRRFLETVSTRTVSFHDGKVDIYEGGFKDYVEALARIRDAAARAERPRDRERKEQRSRQAPPSPPPQKPAPAAKPAAPGPSQGGASGADAHRVRREQARDIERKTKQVALLEARVGELEAEVAHYKKLLVEASGSNWEELHNWAKKERELSGELEKVFKAWVSLSEELGGKGASETT
ncbi:MAG TPA: ABC-F family ATP-binding cassette domain-containing protein [Polyangiaceae bacterium]|nr:ABC-F family ATP-binding cassette domain-containing protein [Polyangiaceae bacterium]